MKKSYVVGLVQLVVLAGMSSLAYADVPTIAAAAPAPLLAAGIPAFLAVGGGALIARLRNRKK